jgi:hypothetical protein
MKTLKTLILGGLVSGAMIFSSGVALARDDDHHDNGRHYGWERGHHYGWSDSRYDWNRRGDSRRELERLRAQRDYDATHHASRKKIAQDNAAIDSLRRDRGWRW